MASERGVPGRSGMVASILRTWMAEALKLCPRAYVGKIRPVMRRISLVNCCLALPWRCDVSGTSRHAARLVDLWVSGGVGYGGADCGGGENL